MITLPDFNKQFDYENNFYLSSDISRIGKVMAHYELYKMAHNLSGAIIECGILKGCSFVRFATFCKLLGNQSKRIIGFDTFGKFPHTKLEEDKGKRLKHIKDCGPESISKPQLMEVLKRKGLEENVELIEGDITKTLPAFIKKNPDLKVSFLNIDVDIYEPSKVILESLYPRVVKGGVVLLDDYNVFAGETKAADEYFKDKKISIKKFPFAKTPSYIVKG